MNPTAAARWKFINHLLTLGFRMDNGKIKKLVENWQWSDDISIENIG